MPIRGLTIRVTTKLLRFTIRPLTPQAKPKLTRISRQATFEFFLNPRGFVATRSYHSLARCPNWPNVFSQRAIVARALKTTSFLWHQIIHGRRLLFKRNQMRLKRFNYILFNQKSNSCRNPTSFGNLKDLEWPFPNSPSSQAAAIQFTHARNYEGASKSSSNIYRIQLSQTRPQNFSV